MWSRVSNKRSMITVTQEGGIVLSDVNDIPVLMGLVMMPEMPVMHVGEFFHAAGMEEKRTVPQSLVDQLPCRTWQGGCSERECSVCLSQFEAGDRVRTLPCKHEFHSSCIDRWLLSMNRTCPCCRLDISDHACKERAMGTDNDVSAGEGARSDLEVLSVRELKEILRARGVDFSDCCEKSHLVDKIRALMH